MGARDAATRLVAIRALTKIGVVEPVMAELLTAAGDADAELRQFLLVDTDLDLFFQAAADLDGGRAFLRFECRFDAILGNAAQLGEGREVVVVILAGVGRAWPETAVAPSPARTACLEKSRRRMVPPRASRSYLAGTGADLVRRD